MTLDSETPFKVDDRRKFLDADALPSPNPILHNILALLDDETASAIRFKELINKEPGLSAQVLRVANSAYYGFRATIDDIGKAVVIIGVEGLRSITLSLALLKQFNALSLPRTFNEKVYWIHSLLTGILAADLASTLQVMPREEAYTCGLLHDLGRVIIAAFYPEEFNEILRISQAKGIGLYEAELEVKTLHTELGGLMAAKWAFPRRIRAVLRWHHEPMSAGAFKVPATLIKVADSLAASVEDPMTSPETDANAPGKAMFDLLGCEPGLYLEYLTDRLPVIHDKAVHLYNSLNGF